MHALLVGADFEENLGLGAIYAALAEDGHRVSIAPYNDPEEAFAIASRAVSDGYDLIGLSMQFQHRGVDFVRLANLLRARGYRGHITAGGQFPSMAWDELLAREPSFDSVVLYEGETTVRELARAIERKIPLAKVSGLAIRVDGHPTRTGCRPLEDLDTLPVPRRYRAPNRHVGIPFFPIMASRGCWGSCAYCSITTLYRSAREHGGGKTLRQRSIPCVAEEMARLYHAYGGGVFCLHDDNFLMPRPKDSRARVAELVRELRQRGVEKTGFIAKCRPECLTRELAVDLAKLDVLRLYIGVENASAEGATHLGRGSQHKHVHDALEAARDSDIFACYNLLLFEPDTTLDHVRENVRFMREHAYFPVNFCRAEPYHGTPLHRSLEASGALSGSYLGWDYRIRDDRAELLYRICSAAFRERNFAPDGVANRMMGLGYSAKLLTHFYPDPKGRSARLRRRAMDLTADIVTETAVLLERAVSMADSLLIDREEIERGAALLGLEIAALDRVRHNQLDELFADMDSVRRSLERPPSVAKRRAMQAVAGGLATLTVAFGSGCGGETMVSDPPPPDAGRDIFVADPPPPDAGRDIMVSDPLPPDAGRDVFVSDPPPPDAGRDIMVADPPPPDAGVKPKDGSIGLRDNWKDTSPERARRSEDLPLFAPRNWDLHVSREGQAFAVRVVGPDVSVSTKWQAEGLIEGDGTEVRWTPASEEDQLAVAIRSRGGVAVISRRAKGLA